MKRIEDYSKTLPVLEIYTAVQSEGSRAGYPTIIIRTTGCTHRCFFGEGGWCDSFYTSIEPEKGKYSFNDIIKIYDENPHITEMMLTGGSPTMHPSLVNELTHFANERGIFITMETEGSHFVETDYPIHLVSLSPKFSNSVPKLGVIRPGGKEVDQKFIDQHNKFRLKLDTIQKVIVNQIRNGLQYHIKPVWDGKDMEALMEIEKFIFDLNIPKDKVWFMPAGDDIPALLENYGPVMDFVRDNGYRFTGRPHIIGFSTQREV